MRDEREEGPQLLSGTICAIASEHVVEVWRRGRDSGPACRVGVSADYFLPAYLIIGVAGTPIQLAVLHVCNEYENYATAMAFYAGTYAASSCVFVIFKVWERA